MPQHQLLPLPSVCAGCAQAVRSTVIDQLHMFDYGTECRSYFGLPRPCNQVVYGQEEPPAYDFSRIKTPLAVFTGGQQQQPQQTAPAPAPAPADCVSIAAGSLCKAFALQQQLGAVT
jgi:hypothetical protein